jgi:hypothetical protein
MKKSRNEQKRIVPEDSLREYFVKIMELNGKGDRFPVDLDDVWPLIYGRKKEAVRALRETGVENVDFQLLRRNAEQNPLNINGVPGGHNRADYYISVPCLEWLIARKHRAVFEVYRKMFHQAVADVTMRDVEGFQGRDYADLLRVLGMSVRLGSFWKRIRRYPQEFKTANGVWYISGRTAGVIRQQARMRQMYVMFVEDWEKYLAGQLALEFTSGPGFSDGTGASRTQTGYIKGVEL